MVELGLRETPQMETGGESLDQGVENRSERPLEDIGKERLKAFGGWFAKKLVGFASRVAATPEAASRVSGRANEKIQDWHESAGAMKDKVAGAVEEFVTDEVVKTVDSLAAKYTSTKEFAVNGYKGLETRASSARNFLQEKARKGMEAMKRWEASLEFAEAQQQFQLAAERLANARKGLEATSK